MDQLNQKDSRQIRKKIGASPRHIELLGVVVILIILVGGYVLLLKPEFTLRKELKTQLLVTKSDLEAKNNKLTELKRLVESFSRVNKTNRQFIDEFIPDGFDLSSVLVNFSAIAAKNGMQIEGIDYSLVKMPTKQRGEDQQAVLADSFVAVDLNLGVEGSGYSDFKNLIRDIENNSRLTEIIAFGFDPLTTHFNLTLRVYYYNSPHVSKTTQ